MALQLAQNNRLYVMCCLLLANSLVAMPFGTEKYFSCYFIWINEGRLVPARRAEIVTQDEYEDATAHSGESKRG